MNASFYSGARGMITEQDKLNVISNNVANVNTVGFKSKSSIFMDLMYYNMHSQDRVTTGTGVRMQHTNTDYSSNGVTQEEGDGFNFAIQDSDGFFMLRNQVTNEITYTRAGNFSLSLHNDGYFYLLSDAQKYVLDGNGNPIRYVNGELTESREYSHLPIRMVWNLSVQQSSGRCLKMGIQYVWTARIC